jgi:hypothetical protein
MGLSGIIVYILSNSLVKISNSHSASERGRSKWNDYQAGYSYAHA